MAVESCSGAKTSLSPIQKCDRIRFGKSSTFITLHTLFVLDKIPSGLKFDKQAAKVSACEHSEGKRIHLRSRRRGYSHVTWCFRNTQPPLRNKTLFFSSSPSRAGAILISFSSCTDTRAHMCACACARTQQDAHEGLQQVMFCAERNWKTGRKARCKDGSRVCLNHVHVG